MTEWLEEQNTGLYGQMTDQLILQYGKCFSLNVNCRKLVYILHNMLFVLFTLKIQWITSRCVLCKLTL